MAAKQKVLVVEDDTQLAPYYKVALERAQFEPDVVDAKDAAISLVREKTYDAAIIDLWLRHDVSHKGGFDILEYIIKCDEGTKALVVSASTEVRDAVRAYRMHSVDFVMKDDELASAQDIIPRLQSALKEHSITRYGGHQKALNEFLAAPEGAHFWESKTGQVLGTSYEKLVNGLEKAFRRYLPVLRKKDGSASFERHPDKKSVGGLFWSKGIGAPIWVAMWGPEGEAIQPPANDKNEMIQEELYSGLSFRIWRVRGTARDEFPEFLWERPWLPKQ